MKLFPRGYVESGRSVVRVLACCLLLCIVILVAAWWTFYFRDSFADQLRNAYGYDGLDLFLGLTTCTHAFLAALLACVSLMLMFGERNRRDVRYGRIGLCIAIASLSI